MSAADLRPGVSVVHCCHNGAEVIAETVGTLRAQEIPAGTGYEVILVDNRCEDDTVALAQHAWGDAPHQLVITSEPQLGLIHARRRGVEYASHEIILFVDDDNLLAPDWVRRLPELFARRPRVAAIGGRNEPELAGEKPPWFEQFASMYACSGSVPLGSEALRLTTLFGAGLAFRTSVLREIFASDLPLFLVGHRGAELSRGEDSELCLRAVLAGWALHRDESLLLRHVIASRRLNWEYVLRARRGGGRADAFLLMYRELAEGRAPLRYRERSEELCKKWSEFWSLLPDIADLRQEGSGQAVRLNYLQGLTEGLLELGADGYRTARRKIVSHFKGA